MIGIRKKYLIIGVTSLGLFTSGTFVGANTSFVTSLISDANNEINGAAYYKKEELLEDLQAKVSTDVKAQLQPIIDEKKQLAEAQLQEYYDQKVANITNEPAFQESMQLMDTTLNNSVDRFKTDIDTAFDELFQ